MTSFKCPECGLQSTFMPRGGCCPACFTPHTPHRVAYSPEQWAIVSTCDKCGGKGVMSRWREVLKHKPSRRMICLSCGHHWGIFTLRAKRRAGII